MEPQNNNENEQPVVVQPTTPEVSGPAPTLMPTPEPTVPAEPVVVSPSPVINEAAPTNEVVTPVVPVVSTTTPPTAGAPIAYTTPGTPETPSGGKKKGLLKAILIAVIVVVVLGGGSAAAYVGVILPNKPQNVLGKSLLNTLEADELSSTGSVSVSSDGVAGKVDIVAQADRPNKAEDVKINLTVSGVKLSVEGRLVKGSIYVKVGDLTEIAQLVGAFEPSYAPLVTSLNGEVANKWIEIDSTLLDTAGLECLVNTDQSLTSSDESALKDAYEQANFATIASTSSDTVNSQKAEKMVVNVNDNKFVSFVNALDGKLSGANKLESCLKSKVPSSVASDKLKGDGKTTPVNVWVDKSNKRIVRIQYSGTQDSSKLAADLTFSYGKVSVAEPTDAIPALQLITQVETQLGGLVAPSTAIAQ